MAQANWTSIGSLPTGGTNWVPHVAQSIDGHQEIFTLDSQGPCGTPGKSLPMGTGTPGLWWLTHLIIR